MICTTNDRITMYFGDAKDPFKPGEKLEFLEAFSSIQQRMRAKSLTFLEQTHSSIGHCIRGEKGLGVGELEGDFLCTNIPGAAIGITTADCLPVIIYDPVKHACSAIHSGWRGSFAGIGLRALHMMSEQFGTQAKDVEIYFGPSALLCCYEVGQDFYEKLQQDLGLAQYANQVVGRRNGKLFFDNVRLNILMFVQAGVLTHNMHTDFSACTICNHSYHSYRRSGELAGRQATVVVLR